MTELSEQRPGSARDLLAAAYLQAQTADAEYNLWRGEIDVPDGGLIMADVEHRREQAQALATIGAGLASVEAADTIARAVAVGEAPAANRAADERQVPTDDRTEAAAVWAARIIDRWQGLNYSARGVVQRSAPTLANTLNDAADLLGANGSAGRKRAAEQAQPLTAVADADRCKSVQLGQRCVRLAHGEEMGHLYPPNVPAGPDRHA